MLFQRCVSTKFIAAAYSRSTLLGLNIFYFEFVFKQHCNVIYRVYSFSYFKYGIYKQREVKQNPIKKRVRSTSFFIGFVLPPEVFKRLLWQV